MTTDTSEQGLECLISAALAGHACEPPVSGTIGEPAPGYGGVGWNGGNRHDYDREYCVDCVQLAAFLRATQPQIAESLALAEDGPIRRKFLARLRSEITRRGTTDALRRGLRHGAHDIVLFHGAPSPGNRQAEERFEQNRFTVTRQLRYSRDESQRALDIVLFINGLPVITFELKKNLTRQTVDDAVEQYKRDRNPREKLFEPGRCIAHFALDESEVRFCTHLKGKDSWFLPFNRGWNDGAGNPPNLNGLKTDYLWYEVLTRASLTDILENYAQFIEQPEQKTGRGKRRQIWPRYHQLDVVHRLLEDAARQGAGQRYLIQHSAGSGKSNSIAWLARQLIDLRRDGGVIFDSVIVVTDRRILDRQINNTIRQYTQVGATVGHAEHSGDLRRFIESGKQLIISTIQKFPVILDEIGDTHRNRRFAIIIDEAHSSQGGRASAALGRALSEAGAENPDETFEDKINRLMESRRLLPNASYFAFTATSKNKTLELFGKPDPQSDGTVKHRAFHSYTMKQAIQENFILDVLTHYTPIASYYRLAKTVGHDPDKLHDLQAELDGAQVYTPDQVEDFVRRYLDGAGRELLDPTLDKCVAAYSRDLDENGQVDFKGKARGFVRTYTFLSCVLPYTRADWEARSIFLHFLIPRLPSPREDDLSAGILNAIDMDSYRIEKQALQKIALHDGDMEIDPVPISAGGYQAIPEMDRLSNIVRQFNDLFGGIEWENRDHVEQLITHAIPQRIAANEAYRNARNHSDEENARIEFDRTLQQVMTSMIRDDNQLFKQFTDNEDFKRWLSNTIFGLAQANPAPLHRRVSPVHP